MPHLYCLESRGGQRKEHWRDDDDWTGAGNLTTSEYQLCYNITMAQRGTFRGHDGERAARNILLANSTWRYQPLLQTVFILSINRLPTTEKGHKVVHLRSGIQQDYCPWHPFWSYPTIQAWTLLHSTISYPSTISINLISSRGLEKINRGPREARIAECRQKKVTWWQKCVIDPCISIRISTRPKLTKRHSPLLQLGWYGGQAENLGSPPHTALSTKHLPKEISLHHHICCQIKVRVPSHLVILILNPFFPISN